MRRMFLSKHLLYAMLNTDLSMATVSLSLCRKGLCLHPSFVSYDSYKHGTFVFGSRNGCFYTYGGLPFGLMDEVQKWEDEWRPTRGRITQLHLLCWSFLSPLQVKMPLTEPSRTGPMGNVMAALVRAVFNTDRWNVCGGPENWSKTRMNSWAPPPWWTVSVLSTGVRLPCWSRHCCFLYWPLLWTVASPPPCCRPGCLGQSSETPVVLGGTGGGREEGQGETERWWTLCEYVGGEGWSRIAVRSPWNAIWDASIKCN